MVTIQLVIVRHSRHTWAFKIPSSPVNLFVSSFSELRRGSDVCYACTLQCLQPAGDHMFYERGGALYFSHLGLFKIDFDSSVGKESACNAGDLT